MKIILAVDFDPIKLGCRIVDLDNNKARDYCFVKVVDTAYTDAQTFIDACLPNFEDFEDKERYFEAVDSQVGYDCVMSPDTINSKASCGDVDHIIYFDPSALRWDIRDTMDGCDEFYNEQTDDGIRFSNDNSLEFFVDGHRFWCDGTGELEPGAVVPEYIVKACKNWLKKQGEE